ncbi:hypothetical protein [Demequina sp. NBRC 110051]|uniref:hypothetical protein n=1 Tax=Demequina sp. NBRC 110051 TaxID=1570340 RepID=UPI0009FF8F4A|nr:hypothetical protein [Demequina sp. NBRC 110051]
MRALRTLISALCILAGALTILGWAASGLVVRAVEEGTALGAVTRTAFTMPGVVTDISEGAQDQVLASLSERGIDPSAVGLDDEVRDVVDGAVRSPQFEDAMVAAADDAQERFALALTEPDREPAPFTLAVDVSDVVNARIDDVPAVGALAPDVALAPVPIAVIEADTFEDVRATYGAMRWLADWGLWAGLALLAVGMLVSHRRRWFIAKALGAVGVLTLGFGLMVRFVDPAAVMGILPGGEEGTLGTLWAAVITEDAAPQITQRAMTIGAVALVAALVAAGLGKAVARR